MADPELIEPYYVDPILASVHGHRVLADVLISYFQSQICAAWSAAGGHSFESIPILVTPDIGGAGADPHLFGGVGARVGAAAPEFGDKADDAKKPMQAPPSVPIYPELRIPPVRIGTRPRSTRPFEEPVPFCASANDLVNPVPPSLFYGSGWMVAHPPQGVSPLLTAAYYWHSSMPMSRIRVPIKAGAGDIGIYYLKESEETIGDGSQLECWVDDNYGGSVIMENAGSVPISTPTYVSSLKLPISDITSFFKARDHRPLRYSRVALCRVRTSRGGRSACTLIQSSWDFRNVTLWHRLSLLD